MDKSLLIFIAVVVLFTYRGYRNGLLKSVGRIIGVAAGYVCAILFTGSITSPVAAYTGLEGIAAFLAASAILFIGASFVVGIVFWIIARLVLRQQTVSTASKLGGAGVGVLTGVLVAIIIVWAFAFVRDVMPRDETFAFVDPEPAPIENLAKQVASGAVDTAMAMGSVEPEVKAVSTALFRSPAEVVQQAQRLSKSPELEQLLTDPRNRMVLDSGDPDEVRQLADFRELAKNPDMQALMKSSGLDEIAAENNQSMDQALAAQFTSVWARTQKVKNNPRLRAILNDGDFQRKVQSGNSLELLSDNRLLELAQIVFGDEVDLPDPVFAKPKEAEPGAGEAQALKPERDSGKKKKKKKIYTWTDENGRMHISDVKPDS